MSNVVARVYKNTGKFEGIKGIETGPEDRFEELLTPVLLSSDNLTLTVGQYSCTLLDSNFDSAPWVGEGVEFSTIYFGDFSKIDPIVGAPSGSDEALFSVDLLNLTVSKGLLWDNSSVNSFDMIYSISGSLGNGEIGISFPNGSAVFTPESDLVFTAINSIDLPYSERVSKNSYSVSRQGDCTFSEIVETGESINPSINKNTGVLTCSEFIEGDHSAESRCASGFSGTISGNKITCNNGYTFELLLQNDQSAVNWSSVLAGGTAIFGLDGSATEDAVNSSTFGGTLNANEGYNTCTFTDPSSSTSVWTTSATLYVYRILTVLDTVSEIYYLKITDPDGKSVLYENSITAHDTFYPIESGQDELWIPSKYRYQNYLI